MAASVTETYGLTHVAVAVDDLHRTKEFYQAVFGMVVMYDTPEFLQLTTPGAHDVLVFEKRTTALAPNAGGIAHIGFRLRQPGGIKSLKERLRHAGADIVDEGEFVPGSPYVFFKDPDGYTLEVWYEAV